MKPLSPYAAALGVERGEDAGGPLLSLAFADRLVGRPGFLHGGAIAGLLEAAVHATVAAALGDEQARLKPVTVTIDFMRGGRPRTTYARGLVIRLGRRVANVEARAWQEDEAAPIGVAHMNLVISRPRAEPA